VWSFVVLFASCVCVCDLFLFLQGAGLEIQGQGQGGFTLNRCLACGESLGLGPLKGVGIDRLSGVGASAGVCLLPPQCWLCVLWAMSAAGWGGGTLWG